MAIEKSQSPQTGQFNSYQNDKLDLIFNLLTDVSIPSNGSIQFLLSLRYSLDQEMSITVSIPSNGSIQFLLPSALTLIEGINKVSIPSNGSIQFLRYL